MTSDKPPETKGKSIPYSAELQRAMRIWQIKQGRVWVLDLLREKHRLSIFDCIGAPADEIERRRVAYRADLDKLEKEWALEDQELEKKP